ncbi:MarR family winged helix-turn-helix transcriptional regulator [Sphingomonas prati]|uniref:DNA-binding MarR family transcriptional regulator n=1 Tax=Sphingomonas prati TaxID=1843237 RepID=A0A7W9BVE2_9SPHN|nr:MarR family winged helix-turn-helix transcriptional regulator [Sphingomonas prati]MBB5730827.1 DNA-binding MarR family transcriptional regulator [Sphingomonas prati]GGE97030.1 transcriptional regulator [Sphingomonas prati]
MHNILTSELLRDLHGSLIDIVSVMNRPQRDAVMVLEAGIALDRAVFPLLVMVERLGSIGIVDLADRVGRDYTTVSRQVTKLESLGFVERQSAATDGRVREAVITASGKALTDKIDFAREAMAGTIFDDWADQDIADLARLMRRFADAVQSDHVEQS